MTPTGGWIHIQAAINPLLLQHKSRSHVPGCAVVPAYCKIIRLAVVLVAHASVINKKHASGQRWRRPVAARSNITTNGGTGLHGKAAAVAH